MSPRLICVSGEDHHLRIPFLLALREHGFEVTAIGTGDPAPFERAGLDYRSFHFDRFINPLADLSAIRTLSRLFADLRPDVVQSFDTKPNLLAPLAARGIGNVPVARTVNGMGWLYSADSPKARVLRPIYLGLNRLTARWTAATVFQNRTDQAFFESHRLVGSGRSELIRGSGADIEAFERAQLTGAPPHALRQALSLGAAPVVITVTRMTRHKGVPTLLEAAALVHQVQPDIRFLLVGPRESEGPLAVTQAEIDRHAPYVIATGPRTDVPSLLALADVFAFPTEYREGLPRVLLEAALAGLPIVTSRMPGCTDIVRDGWSGFLVPLRDPQALADRILSLIRDRRLARQMAGRAAAIVRQELGLKTVAARYAALYGELLNHAPSLRPAEPVGRQSRTAAVTLS